MRKLIILTASILFIRISNAQDTLHFKPVPYKVTVSTTSNPGVAKGYLKALTDSSIYVSPVSVRFSGYANNNSGLTAYQYNNISEVRIRRTGSTGRGILIGAIAGAVTGAIVGFADGDDYKKNPGGWCFLCLTAGEKAAGAGVALGVTGGLIGGIVGALAHKTFIINSKKEKFDELKWKLIN